VTEAEARERALRVWGARRVVAVHFLGPVALEHEAEWDVELTVDTRWHGLNRNGHLVCAHEDCLAMEARL